MKRNDPKRVDAIISMAFDRCGTREAFDRRHICYLWPEIVGPAINRFTTRRWVEHDELHVCIASGPLKNDLSFMQARLVERLNAAAGANVITKIIFH